MNKLTMLIHSGLVTAATRRLPANPTWLYPRSGLQKECTPMKKAYYLIVVEGVEPILRGPFRSELGQSKAAKRIRRSQGEDGLLFWAEVDDTGSLSVGPYAAAFFLRESTKQAF